MPQLSPGLLAGHALGRYGCPAGGNRARRQEPSTMRSHCVYPCLSDGHAGSRHRWDMAPRGHCVISHRRGILSLTPFLQKETTPCLHES